MKALQLILQRLFLLVVVLFVVSVLTFGIVNVLPGDVANAMLGDLATPTQVVALRRQMGLDLPLLVRYGSWIGGLLHGNFGRSLQFGVPIGPMLLGRLCNSAILGGITLLLAVPLSILLGVLAGVRQGRWVDR
ncbi:MAG TPA: ABC transporter permease, partial [Acetobacteraceae bacterium]